MLLAATTAPLPRRMMPAPSQLGRNASGQFVGAHQARVIPIGRSRVEERAQAVPAFRRLAENRHGEHVAREDAADGAHVGPGAVDVLVHADLAKHAFREGR
jgi:hypothetical protein